MNFGESRLQVNCVRWFDFAYPKLKLNLFSIPNEGARSAANGARMKAQGRRSGVADIFFAIPNSTANLESCGLFIEFKYGKAKQSDSQIAFQKAVESEGYKYAIVRDFYEFKNLIEDYLN